MPLYTFIVAHTQRLYVTEHVEAENDEAAIAYAMATARDWIGENRSVISLQRPDGSEVVDRIDIPESDTDTPPVSLHCPECGSENVSFEGFIRWSAPDQRFEVDGLCDKGHCCGDCGAEFRKAEERTAQ